MVSRTVTVFVLALLFTSSAHASNDVHLAWDAAANAAGYRVELRTLDSDTWTNVGTTEALGFSLTNLAGGLAYAARVYSYNSGGESEPTAPLEFFAPPVPLLALARLQAGRLDRAFSIEIYQNGYLTTPLVQASVAGNVEGLLSISSETALPRAVTIRHKTAGFLSATTTGTISSTEPLELVPGKAGDTSGDNVVNLVDYSSLLARWFDNTYTPADLNSDGTVNLADLALVLANYNERGT